ncbi:MAG: GlsB/YeaQ/YmgE family stress response membrane protein [Planctomycetota bacterium]
MELLWFALIGMVSGWLAGSLMRGGGFGLIGNLVVGVLGAFLGGWLLGELGISFGGTIGSIVTATIGAMVLLFVAGLLTKKK